MRRFLKAFTLAALTWLFLTTNEWPVVIVIVLSLGFQPLLWRLAEEAAASPTADTEA